MLFNFNQVFLTRRKLDIERVILLMDPLGISFPGVKDDIDVRQGLCSAVDQRPVGFNKSTFSLGRRWHSGWQIFGILIHQHYLCFPPPILQGEPGT